MTEQLNVQQMAQRLMTADNILILCHKNPDGDTIGCGSALYCALKALDKNVAVLCSDAIPNRYAFTNAHMFKGEFEPQTVVAVDVASVQLFGENNGMTQFSRHVDLCIDHHAGNSGYADFTLLNGSAAAAAELLYEVINAMAAFTAASRIDDFAYTPQQNIGHAMTTLMAQNRGAGKHDRVKQGFHCGMRIEAAYGVLIAVVCFAGAPFIMKLFVTDPEVVHLGVRFLRTVSLFYLMPAATNGIQGFFRGIGDLKVTLVSSTFNMVFRVAAAAVFVLVWKMEIEALPYSYAVGWVVMLLYELPMLVRYLRSHGDEL